MSVIKSFVVKNGLEVNDNLLVADSELGKVAIGKTLPNYTLDVDGNIGVTDFYSVGVSSFSGTLKVGSNGEVLAAYSSGGVSIGISALIGSEKLRVNGNQIITNGNLGIGSANPSEKIDCDGNANITGFVNSDTFIINGTTVIDDSRNINNINNINASLSGTSILGITTTVDLTSQKLTVSGLSNLGFTTISNLRVTGISTLGITSTTNLISHQLNVSGISTLGVTSISQLGVSGISTLGITSISQLTVTGVSTLGITSISQLTVTGVSTLGVTSTTNLTSQQLNVSGVGTIGTVRIISGIVTATSGIVTYYGDGGRLSNIIQGVGIRTSNTSQPLGVGITILEIRGSGIDSISVSSGIGTIVIEDENTPVSIGTVPPTGVTAGNLWYNSTEGRTFIYYTDDDSSQWVDLAPDNNSLGSATLNSGGLSDLSLRFVNDENTGFFSPSNGEIVFVSDGAPLLNIGGGGYINIASGEKINFISGGSIDFVNGSGGSINGVTDIFSSNVTIGSLTKTGTASQPLQVFGGGYISGNLGIGTTNPQSNFHIYGSGFDLLKVERTISNNTSIEYKNPTSSMYAGMAGNALGWGIGDVADLGSSAFFIVERSTGDVGIGTTNPTTKLDVNGNIRCLDINSTSDQNLKTNLEVIQDPLEKIQRINGYTFNWKETQKPSLGVIAQELEKVLPELVSNTDPKTVSYNGLIALLIEGMKEQQREINLLKENLHK